jgi:AGAP011961-PA
MFVKDIRKDFYDLLIGKRILVLVNYDIDALCATKLLANLFQFDNILYTIFPVLDTEDLFQVYNHHRNSVKYVLFLNIGATFDVIDLLEPEEEQVFFIADNHRPIDVYNIYRGEQLR